MFRIRTRRARQSAEVAGGHDARGFSLVETSVFLGTAAVLASALATVGFQSLDTARGVVARDDVERIAAAMGQLLIDRGNLTLIGLEGAPIELIAGRGAAPDRAPDPVLRRPIDGASVVDLDDVLYTNAVALPEATSPWDQGWRGPYLQVAEGNDPWGHRYAVRMASPDSPVVLVISAGPDGTVDTATAGRAPRRAGDDVMFLLSVGR